jgi:ankyrin repeat protein
MVLMVMAALCLLTGCNFAENKDVDHLVIAQEAVSNQDYKLASRHAKLVLKDDPGNREAEAILSYLTHEDNMLVAAFWKGDSEALKYLAGIVHDINAKDPRFDAPVLVLAAAWGHTEMVEILLEAGADPNCGADKDGLTALMWACKNFDEQLEMVRALLKAGAEVDARSNYDETPLSIAYEYENHNIVTLLKEYGALE